MFGLCLANLEQLPENWTFRSSAGIKRQIDFILFSSDLCCETAGAVDVLDLGSDHRAAHCSLCVRTRCFKRFWKPLSVPRGWMPNNQQQYHASLQMRLSNQQTNTITELERLVHSAAISSMKCEHSRLVEPWEHVDFQHLLQQRKSAKYYGLFLGAIPKILEGWTCCFVIRLRPLTCQRPTCRVPKLLQIAYPRYLHQATCMYKHVEATWIFRPYRLFSFLNGDKHCNICTIAEVVMMQLWCWKRFKLGCKELHECLLDISNRMLLEESLEPSWQHSLFKMLPKPCDSTQASNWRPIAVLKITYYKVFAKLLGARLHNVLERA